MRHATVVFLALIISFVFSVPVFVAADTKPAAQTSSDTQCPAPDAHDIYAGQSQSYHWNTTENGTIVTMTNLSKKACTQTCASGGTIQGMCAAQNTCKASQTCEGKTPQLPNVTGTGGNGSSPEITPNQTVQNDFNALTGQQSTAPANSTQVGITPYNQLSPEAQQQFNSVDSQAAFKQLNSMTGQSLFMQSAQMYMSPSGPALSPGINDVSNLPVSGNPAYTYPVSSPGGSDQSIWNSGSTFTTLPNGNLMTSAGYIVQTQNPDGTETIKGNLSLSSEDWNQAVNTLSKNAASYGCEPSCFIVNDANNKTATLIASDSGSYKGGAIINVDPNAVGGTSFQSAVFGTPQAQDVATSLQKGVDVTMPDGSVQKYNFTPEAASLVAPTIVDAYNNNQSNSSILGRVSDYFSGTSPVSVVASDKSFVEQTVQVEVVSADQVPGLSPIPSSQPEQTQPQITTSDIPQPQMTKDLASAQPAPSQTPAGQPDQQPAGAPAPSPQPQGSAPGQDATNPAAQPQGATPSPAPGPTAPTTHTSGNPNPVISLFANLLSGLMSGGSGGSGGGGSASSPQNTNVNINMFGQSLPSLPNGAYANQNSVQASAQNQKSNAPAITLAYFTPPSGLTNPTSNDPLAELLQLVAQNPRVQNTRTNPPQAQQGTNPNAGGTSGKPGSTQPTQIAQPTPTPSQEKPLPQGKQQTPTPNAQKVTPTTPNPSLNPQLATDISQSGEGGTGGSGTRHGTGTGNGNGSEAGVQGFGQEPQQQGTTNCKTLSCWAKQQVDNLKSIASNPAQLFGISSANAGELSPRDRALLDAQIAQKGLDVMKGLSWWPTQAQTNAMNAGTQAAQRLSDSLKNLGNNALGGDVARYVAFLHSMAQPENQTMANQQKAGRIGDVLLARTRTFLGSLPNAVAAVPANQTPLAPPAPVTPPQQQTPAITAEKGNASAVTNVSGVAPAPQAIPATIGRPAPLQVAVARPTLTLPPGPPGNIRSQDDRAAAAQQAYNLARSMGVRPADLVLGSPNYAQAWRTTIEATRQALNARGMMNSQLDFASTLAIARQETGIPGNIKEFQSPTGVRGLMQVTGGSALSMLGSRLFDTWQGPWDSKSFAREDNIGSVVTGMIEFNNDLHTCNGDVSCAAQTFNSGSPYSCSGMGCSGGVPTYGPAVARDTAVMRAAQAAGSDPNAVAAQLGALASNRSRSPAALTALSSVIASSPQGMITCGYRGCPANPTIQPGNPSYSSGVMRVSHNPITGIWYQDAQTGAYGAPSDPAMTRDQFIQAAREDVALERLAQAGKLPQGAGFQNFKAISSGSANVQVSTRQIIGGLTASVQQQFGCNGTDCNTKMVDYKNPQGLSYGLSQWIKDRYANTPASNGTQIRAATVMADYIACSTLGGACGSVTQGNEDRSSGTERHPNGYAIDVKFANTQQQANYAAAYMAAAHTLGITPGMGFSTSCDAGCIVHADTAGSQFGGTGWAYGPSCGNGTAACISNINDSRVQTIAQLAAAGHDVSNTLLAQSTQSVQTYTITDQNGTTIAQNVQLPAGAIAQDGTVRLLADQNGTPLGADGNALGDGAQPLLVSSDATLPKPTVDPNDANKVSFSDDRPVQPAPQQIPASQYPTSTTRPVGQPAQIGMNGQQYCVISTELMLAIPCGQQQPMQPSMPSMPSQQSASGQSLRPQIPIQPTPVPLPNPVVTPPQPALSLVANPATIAPSKQTRIAWSSVGTISCRVYAPGNFVIGTTTRGSVLSPILATTTPFTAICLTPASTTIAATTTVIVR